MAGDWIKMRPSLLTSPKVNFIARQLESDTKVSRALSSGFGGHMSEIVTRNVMRNVTVASLLVIWGAANEHTSDGVFTNADLSDIDDMVGIPGFGDAMVAVGWAVFDEEELTVTLPNFNEYNTSGRERSASAKSGAERQREYRERQKSQESDVTRDVTRNRREDKRREELTTSSLRSEVVSDDDANRKTSGTPKRATQLPDDFAPDGTAETIAADLGVSLSAELPKFRDYHAARGKPMKDWQAALRTWLRNAKAFARPVTNTQQKDDRRQQWLDELTGRNRNDAIEAPARLVG